MRIRAVIKNCLNNLRFGEYTSYKLNISIAQGPHGMLKWFKMGYKWRDDH